MIVAALLGAFGMGGMTRLSVDFQWKEFVKEHHRIREAIRFVDQHRGGYDWAATTLSRLSTTRRPAMRHWRHLP